MARPSGPKLGPASLHPILGCLTGLDTLYFLYIWIPCTFSIYATFVVPDWARSLWTALVALACQSVHVHSPLLIVRSSCTALPLSSLSVKSLMPLANILARAFPCNWDGPTHWRRYMHRQSTSTFKVWSLAALACQNMHVHSPLPPADCVLSLLLYWPAQQSLNQKQLPNAFYSDN